MHCRTCDHHLIDKARFCDDCGLSTAALQLDADGLMSYCGRCSGLLRGKKKFCIYCGEASPHSDKYKKRRETGFIEEILMDPRVQMAIIALLLIVAALPAVSPIRYKTMSSAPFVTVVWEEEEPRAPARVIVPSQDSFKMEQLIADDEDRDDGMSISMAGGVTRDSRGNLYVSDVLGHRVYRIAPNGERAVLAGTGAEGFDGDGGVAASARLSAPRGLAVDKEDNIYIADTGNNRIRRVNTRGIIKTVAGSDGDPADQPGDVARFSSADEATLLSPTSVSIDHTGALYVAENACKIGRRKPTVWVLRQKM
jgi:hypothetical protein